MKSNKRRGFTLVELLVVIAILAILATVSVVGYTSFIQRATVSNDENIAAQLNQFLEAYKVDHKGNYYGQEITEDNIWYITQEILEDSQYGELVPQSLEYDYHFYFDLTEGKYVVMKDSDVGISLARRFYDLIANAEGPYESRPGNSFTNDNRYFLVDTSGSPLADAVRLFYTPVLDENSVAKDIANVVTEAINSEKVPTDLKTLLATTYFVVKDAEPYSYGTSNLENVFIHEGVPSVSITGVSFAEGVKPTIVVPNGATVTRLDIPEESTVIFNGTDWEALREIVDAGFVDSDVKVFVSGNEYKVDDVNVTDKNGARVTTLKYNNPVQEFVIKADDVTTFTDSEGLHVVFEAVNNGLNLSPSNEKGAQFDKNPELALSKPEYFWEITSIKLVGGTEKTGAEIANYVSIDSTGLIKFVKTNAYEVESISVEAKAVLPKSGDTEDTNPEYASNTYTIGISGITGATININNQTIGADLKAHLIHNGKADTSYNESVFNVLSSTTGGNQVNGMSYNKDVKLTILDGSNASINGATLTTSGASDDLKVNVQIGCYVSYDVTIQVFDSTSLPVTIKNNIGFVGSEHNGIPVNALFDNIPAGAQVMVYTNAESLDANDFMNLSGRNRLVTQEQIDANPSDYDDYTNDTIRLVGTNAAVVSSDTVINLKGIADKTSRITFAIVHNGVRVSDDLTVEVVRAQNITSWSELDGDNADGTAEVGVDTVILNEIKLNDSNATKADVAGVNGNYAKLTINNGVTFYGNYLTLNLAGLTYNGAHGFVIINSGATLRDAKVIGDTFKDHCVLKGDLNYGTGAVLANYGSTIDNCYLAYTRSPLTVGAEITKSDAAFPSQPVTVKNTVIYGGVYTNVDLKGGELLLKGTVITLNDSGTGIVGWFQSLPNKYKITLYEDEDNADNPENAVLKQYNFISQNDVDKLTNYPITGVIRGNALTVANIPCGAIFSQIMERDALKTPACTKLTYCTGECGKKTGVVFERHDKDACTNHPESWHTSECLTSARMYENFLFDIEETGENNSKTTVTYVNTGMVSIYVSKMNLVLDEFGPYGGDFRDGSTDGGITPCPENYGGANFEYMITGGISGAVEIVPVKVNFYIYSMDKTKQANNDLLAEQEDAFYTYSSNVTFKNGNIIQTLQNAE